MSKTTIPSIIQPNFTDGWKRWDNGDIPEIRILSSYYCQNIISWNYPQHNMPFWYLWYPESSGGQLVFDGEIIHLEPGFRILIPPHTPFSTRNSEKFNQYYIHFSLESSSRNNYFSVHRRPIIMPADDPETFFAGLRKKDISSREILLTAYMQTADALMNIPSQYMLAPNEVPMDPRISAALKFMQNSSGATPTNGEIARKAGMSENNFLRLFRLELKDSPRQYMLRLHLHRCLDMLKDPSLSLDDVAQAGGFADRYHFSKAFSKVFGTSPGRYRRLARENAASDQ